MHGIIIQNIDSNFQQNDICTMLVSFLCTTSCCNGIVCMKTIAVPLTQMDKGMVHLLGGIEHQ